jgi:ubiquinone/menaquinone biosynthesis C-methylase UbiE
VTNEPPSGDLAEYYRQRAAEYDAVYAKPERQHDLARLRTLLPAMTAGQHVLEIAAGTGYWTQVIATSAVSVTATDLSRETLAVAAARDYGPAPVELMTADAYRLDQVPGDFDLVFCGFWWSHIRRADVARFLAGVWRRVGPGTTLLMLDNRYVPGSNHPITRVGRDGDSYQDRRLGDGRRYEVLKNFPDRAQLASDLEPWTTAFSHTELDYYWLSSCTLAGSA